MIDHIIESADALGGSCSARLPRSGWRRRRQEPLARRRAARAASVLDGAEHADHLAFTGAVRIPRCERANSDQGELVTVQKAAEILGIAAPTVHRWINDGFIAAEQITPGAPWQIRVTDDLRARFVEDAPVGYVPMVDAMRIPVRARAPSSSARPARGRWSRPAYAQL
jgi:hypothetical protein